MAPGVARLKRESRALAAAIWKSGACLVEPR
jgi:hypothetical protein